MTLIAPGKALDLKDYTLTACKEGASWLRDYITAIKNGQYHPFTKLERKAREATRNEPWGPTGMILNELAEASFNYNDCEVIFAVVQLRLGYPPAKWRNVYKALTVLEFMVKRGSERCVAIARNELSHRLADLEGFQYVSPEGRDQGINVRHRAQAIGVLLRDSERLKEERAAFAAKRRMYAGYSREDMATPARSASTGYDGIGSGGSGLRRSRSDTGESSFTAYGRDTPSSRETTPQSQPPRSITRGAGEMKGVTMEQNKKQLAALRALLEQPGNRSCADCTGGGAGGRATWASINTGVFICMRCAGHHRGLGVHISKVRSCTLDTWLPEQVAFMARTGNARANAYYEAKLESSQKPSYHSPDLEAFIRRKYNGAYAEGSWPPPDALEAAATPPASGESRRSFADGVTTAASSTRTTAKLDAPRAAGSFWASQAPTQPSHVEEEHGFGESAFAAGPGAKSAIPDLMDFGDENLPQSQPAGSQQTKPSTQAGPQQHVGAAPGLGGFADMMTASAQLNLLDADPFAADRAHSSETETLPAQQQAAFQQPAPHPPQSGLSSGLRRSLHGAFDAASAPVGTPAHDSPFGEPPAFPAPAAAAASPQCGKELSFDGEPVPDWDLPAGMAGAAMPAARPQLALVPVRQPGAARPGTNTAAAVSPFAQVAAAAAAQAGPSATAAAAGTRPGKQPSRTESRAASAKAADPTGFVLEDLLAHAVENLRIKNAAKTTLAGRPPTQAPSLMEQKLARHIAPAGM